MKQNQMQALVDSMSEMGRLERSRYHVTLGRMIKIAAEAKGNVRFADGGSPGDEMSYRGYYSDLAFETQQIPKAASGFLAQCQKALGATYDGYKGCDFVMAASTPLWRASYGCCGEAIVRAVVEENGDLVLHCIALED
jgi:hypothetical protein